MRTKRLMKIDYPHNVELVDKLKESLKNISCPHVVFDDSVRYRIYIDRGSNTWEAVIRAVNSVHAVKFTYENDYYIKNGKLYQPLLVC